jgi:hypothetical protein
MMNTMKLPSLKGKPSFTKSLGLELTIDEPEIRERPKFTSIHALDDDETEMNDFNMDSKNKSTRLKNKSPTNFANENVMSKSNLRQPKSFNFADDSDEEEEKSMPSE